MKDLILTKVIVILIQNTTTFINTCYISVNLVPALIHNRAAGSGGAGGAIAPPVFSSWQNFLGLKHYQVKGLRFRIILQIHKVAGPQNCFVITHSASGLT